jgi:hypothetical protein
VPGPTHNVDAWVLGRRPISDAFQGFTLFASELGGILGMQRVSKKSTPVSSLDLFDRVALTIEEPTQGQAWFIKEVRVLRRMTEIGRSYDALTFASRFASLVARNQVPEESRSAVDALLGQSFEAFAHGDRPDIVYLKSLYRFCRDEGYPLKQGWVPTLAAPDQASVAALLNKPLTEQTADVKTVARLQRRLDDYLRGETEILLD